MSERYSPEAHRFTPPEIAGSLLFLSLGPIGLITAMDRAIEARPLAENGAVGVAILGPLISIIITQGLFRRGIPEAAKNYARVGVDSAEYLVWCAQQSTRNIARTAIMSTRPVVPSPTW